MRVPYHCAIGLYRIGIGYCLFQLSSNASLIENIQACVIGYLYQAAAFCIAHIGLHAGFHIKGGLAYYHHHVDPTIYEKIPGIHRASYYLGLSGIGLTIMTVVSNPLIAVWTCVWYQIQILAHEWYHVGDTDRFYGKNSRVLSGPIKAELSLMNLLNRIGIINKEHHAKHHVSTKRNAMESEAWTDMAFLPGERVIFENATDALWKVIRSLPDANRPFASRMVF